MRKKSDTKIKTEFTGSTNDPKHLFTGIRVVLGEKKITDVWKEAYKKSKSKEKINGNYLREVEGQNPACLSQIADFLKNV